MISAALGLISRLAVLTRTNSPGRIYFHRLVDSQMIGTEDEILP